MRFPVMIEYSKSRFKTNSQLVRDENHRYATEGRRNDLHVHATQDMNELNENNCDVIRKKNWNYSLNTDYHPRER